MNEDLFKHNRKSFMELGQIYFWTATINKWQKLLQQDVYKEIIIDSLRYLTEKEKIDVFGFVIMPNHIHLIWRINENNGKETSQASFLKYTAHEFKKLLSQYKQENLGLSDFEIEANNKSYEFWQRDSLAIHLYTQKVAYQKLDYIHANPVNERWCLAKQPSDYFYSTASYYEETVNNFDFIKDLRNEF
jgi:putative transposase